MQIYIIESVGAHDLFDRRSEGEALSRTLSLMTHEAVYRPVNSESEFLRELQIFQRSGADVLHIGCHGNQKGLALTNGDFLDWVRIFAHLEPILGKGQMLALSSCSALAGQKLIDLFKCSTTPPFSVIGCDSDIRWDHALIAWSLIYASICPHEKDPAKATASALAAIRLALNQNFYIWCFAKGLLTDNPDPNAKDWNWTGQGCLDAFRNDNPLFDRNDVTETAHAGAQ